MQHRARTRPAMGVHNAAGSLGATARRCCWNHAAGMPESTLLCCAYLCSADDACPTCQSVHSERQATRKRMTRAARAATTSRHAHTIQHGARPHCVPAALRHDRWAHHEADGLEAGIGSLPLGMREAQLGQRLLIHCDVICVPLHTRQCLCLGQQRLGFRCQRSQLASGGGGGGITGRSAASASARACPGTRSGIPGTRRGRCGRRTIAPCAGRSRRYVCHSVYVC